MKAKLEKAVGVIIPILKIALVSFMQAFMAALAVETASGTSDHTANLCMVWIRLQSNEIVRNIVGAST